MNSQRPLLDLVAEHLDSIRTHFDDAQRQLLLSRVRALAETAPDDNRAVRKALQGVRLALLPLPFEHPVRLAVDSERLAGPPVGPAAVGEARMLLAQLTEQTDTPVTPETIVETSQRRLLTAPSLSEDEARARCDGAVPSELIRLPDPERGPRYPDFQFVRDGRPYGVVLKVNRTLLADIDPWGAAAWWLGGNRRLGGPPASLLGELPDEELDGAARALVEGDG
ncbi:hypothetical protein [Streptomyces luteocolor]|uniref:hypothetical protein n=1 Tax=Streptomyces luteocolor TaxID=285500 RepID=UPI0008528D18|nr:hypothetical protein [Streptomyces luteocolor]